MNAKPWSMLLALTVAATGCGVTSHYTGYKQKVYHVEAPKKTGESFSTANKIAFFPYLNTAQFAHQLDTNLAYANHQLGEAVEWVTKQLPSELEILSPHRSQSALSAAGLTARYADILDDYVRTGIIDERGMRDIMDTLKVDLLFQGVLQGYNVDSDTGLFRAAAMQFIAFDRKTGRIDWNISVRVHEEIEDHTQVERSSKNQVLLGILSVLTLLATEGIGYALVEDDEPEAALAVGLGGIAGSTVLAITAIRDSEIDEREPDVRGADLTIEAGIGEMLKRCVQEIVTQLREAKLQPAPPAQPPSKPARRKRKRKRR